MRVFLAWRLSLFSLSHAPFFFLFQDPFQQAGRASYCHLYLSMSLGYFISQSKSTLLPTQRLVHLGYGIDNTIGAFFVTDRLRAKFRTRRDDLLDKGAATLSEMQSFLGKCNHLRLVFPAVSLFTLECRLFLPSLGEDAVLLPPSVLEEMKFWTFVDSFTAPIPFRRQRHASLSLFTDASGFAWGAKVRLPSGPIVLRDYWMADLMPRDICVKEAMAVLFAISAFADSFRDHRVDVFSDNEGVVHAWSGLRARSPDLVEVLRSLFLLCCEFNVSLSLHWVSTLENEADAPSREIKRSDASLSDRLRRRVWEVFGPFSIDLMALPSNAFRSPGGVVLPFFAPFIVSGSAGTNVFAQPRPFGLLYAFPPFIMITSLILLLKEWGSVDAILILPLFPSARPPWMRLLRPYIVDQRLLSSPSDLGVLNIPSSHGASPNLLPLGFGLAAFRCSFPPSPSPPLPPPPRHHRVLIIADSMLRPLERLVWPVPFNVTIRCLSGGRLREIVFELLRAISSGAFDACVVHGGVNDISRNMPSPAAALDEASCHAVNMISAHCRLPTIISTVCQTRRSDLNVGVARLNGALRQAAASKGWVIASHDNVVFSDLKDDVHLKPSGVVKVFRSLHHSLRCVFGLASILVAPTLS